jgi:hypothetical protein
MSACVLIICKKFINKLWFGAVLAGITLFYSVNLYHGWLPVNHARSFLGYAFFMWLGVQFKVYLYYVKVFVERLRWRILIPVIIVAFALACREGWTLKSIGCIDSYASIRFSNACLSLLLLFAVLKTGKMTWVEKIKPHKYIYGVYLVHSVIILRLMPRISKLISQFNLFANIPLAVLVQLFVFACIISLTYGVVIIIKKSPLKFMVGRA